MAGPGNAWFCPACAMKDFWVQEELTEVPQLAASGGKIIQGHELVEELARGGMGVVYKAWQLSPRREVALKMLLPLTDRVKEFRERFHLEARALAELDHPSILPLYTAGEFEGLPFFTMKLAHGGSLAKLLKDGTRLNYKEIAQLISTMAEAVFYANQRGVLHRDIKPANILFDEARNPFLADFGLAKLVGGEMHTLSLGAMGTPHYMAPEVALRGARAATASSDVYGLGAVLYELLAGKPPFHVEGMLAVLKKVAEEDPAAPSTLTKGVPRDLEVICLSCLQKDPKKRYLTAQSLADDVQRWLQGIPITARRVGPVERLQAWVRRRPALAALSGALLLTLVGGSVWLTVKNIALEKAKRSSERALAVADSHVEIVLGELATELETIGRLPILEHTYQRLEQTYREDPLLLETSPGQLQRARLLAKWAASKIIGGDLTGAAEKAQEAKAMLAKIRATTGSTLDVEAVHLEATLAEAAQLTDTGQTTATLTLLAAQAQNPAAALPQWRAKLASMEAAVYLRDSASESLADKSLQAIDRSVSAAEAWAAAAPEEHAALAQLSRSLSTRVTTKMQAHGMLDQHEDYSPEQQRVAEACIADHANVMRLTEPLKAKDSRLDYYWICSRRSIAYFKTRLPGEKIPLEKESEGIINHLAAMIQRDPTNEEWLLEQCHSIGDMAHLQQKIGNTTKELIYRAEACRVARNTFMRTVKKRPSALLVMRNELAYAKALSRSGDTQTATPLLLNCLRPTEEYLAMSKSVASEVDGYKRTVYVILEELGQAPEPHLTHLAACLDFAEQQINRQPLPEWNELAGDLARKLADKHLGTGNAAASLKANQTALKHRTALLRTGWELKKTEGKVANAYQMTARDQVSTNAIPEALATAKQALQLWQEIPNLPGDRSAWTGACLIACKAILEPAAAPSPADTELRNQARTLAETLVATLYRNRPPETPNDHAALERLQKFSTTNTTQQ